MKIGTIQGKGADVVRISFEGVWPKEKVQAAHLKAVERHLLIHESYPLPEYLFVFFGLPFFYRSVARPEIENVRFSFFVFSAIGFFDFRVTAGFVEIASDPVSLKGPGR